MKWNQCQVCGRFIGFDDFASDPPKAKNVLVNPSAYGAEEKWDTYHVACVEPLAEHDEVDDG